MKRGLKPVVEPAGGPNAEPSEKLDAKPPGEPVVKPTGCKELQGKTRSKVSAVKLRRHQRWCLWQAEEQLHLETPCETCTGPLSNTIGIEYISTNIVRKKNLQHAMGLLVEVIHW